MTFDALTDGLTLAHRHLELDQPLEAATQIALAAAECERAGREGTRVDGELLRQLVELERRCVEAAAQALSRVVESGRQLNTSRRAIRAYAGGRDGP